MEGDALMADLRVRIGEVEFANPVGAASGTFAYGIEYEEFLDISKIGAIFTKGLSLKPIIGNPPPRLHETASGLLNSIGLQNVGVEAFCEEKLPRLRELGACVIVNVFGNSADEYKAVAARLESEEGITGYELNLSCPNVKAGGITFGTDPDTVHNLTAQIRAMTGRLVIVKLTPNVTDIVPIAQAAKDGGADAVSAVNTLLGMAINLERRRPVLANVVGGLSGPAIKPVALRVVHQIYKGVDIPVIGIGGIANARDALEFMVAGATMIQVGSQNYRDPATTLNIIKEMDEYLDEHEISSVCEMTGTLLE